MHLQVDFRAFFTVTIFIFIILIILISIMTMTTGSEPQVSSVTVIVEIVTSWPVQLHSTVHVHSTPLCTYTLPCTSTVPVHLHSTVQCTVCTSTALCTGHSTLYVHGPLYTDHHCAGCGPLCTDHGALHSSLHGRHCILPQCARFLFLDLTFFTRPCLRRAQRKKWKQETELLNSRGNTNMQVDVVHSCYPM